jgi:N-acetylglucosaminyldiphosphoundecaprenol N-acetyl-beta-D-mannosaminyltransferase
MPLIWIAKLLGIPLNERIAGSDLFGRLKSMNDLTRPFRVFLLGGAEGAAKVVCDKLNAQKGGLECVGVLNPGFGTIEEMSTTQVIDTINASKADLLAVFFGAEKAQAWLMYNHRRLRTPIRAQFGATINFEAGTVRRAPQFLRSTGFEWLWRIKEEPYLWRRYWNDGMVLLRLLVTCVLPMLIRGRWRLGGDDELSISEMQDLKRVTLILSGSAVGAHVDKAISIFRSALNLDKEITIDLSKMRSIDSRFFGLLLMMRKQLARRGQKLKFAGITSGTRKIFRLNRFEFLFSGEF